MTRALLAAARAATRVAHSMLDAPARLRVTVRSLDARIERMLNPPAVVVDPEPTVPYCIAYGLEIKDADEARHARLMANLIERRQSLDLQWSELCQQHGWN